MPDVTIRMLAEQPTLVTRGKVAVPDMPGWLGRAYHAVVQQAADSRVTPAGPPFARYRPLDFEHREFEVEAGFPFEARVSGGGDVVASTLPAGPAAVVWHIGRYEAMVPTYEAIVTFLAEQLAEALGEPWEIYHSDPDVEPDPDQWRTEIIQPFLA